MSTETYLVLANSIVWVGMGLYLTFLGVNASRLNKRLSRIELLEDGDE